MVKLFFTSFLSLSTEFPAKYLQFKTGAVYDRKNTNGFIPVILEGKTCAKRILAHCCRLKRFRYISDKQPHLGVNHTHLELQSLRY